MSHVVLNSERYLGIKYQWRIWHREGVYVHKTVACCRAKIKTIVDVDAKLSETCNKWYDKMINISSAKIRSFYRNPIFHIPLPGDAMKVIRGEHLDMPLNPEHPSFPYQSSYPE